MKENFCHHITAAGNHTVKTGRGNLSAVVVNTTAAGTIKVYDGVDATGKLLASFKASVAEQEFNFHGTIFLNGLFVVTTANSDVSILYN